MRDEHTLQQAVSERVAGPYTGYSSHALRVWRRQGRGPAYIRVGRSVRYRLVDLDAWIEQHRVDPSQHAEAGR